MRCEKCGKWMLWQWDYKAGKNLCKSCTRKYDDVLTCINYKQEANILSKIK